MTQHSQTSAPQSECGLFSFSSFACISVHLRLFPFCLALFAATVSASAHGSGPKSGAPGYKDVQAIFRARCVVCHSQEMIGNGAVSGGLALDTYAAITKGVAGDKGAHPILMAGKSGDSELYKRLITTSPAKLMPKGGSALPAAQIASIKKWIDAGAPGAVGAEALPKAGANSVPMPGVIGTLDVSLRTRITVSPDMLNKPEAVVKPGKAGKDAKPGKNASATTGKQPPAANPQPPAPLPPKDTALAFAMKIGPLPPQTAIAFSPDGKRLAVGGYRAVIVWDTTTGQPVGSVTGLAGAVQSLAYRPDGAQLAIAGGTAGLSGEVKVVDAKTLAIAGPTLGGHTDVVFSVAWSADGTRLATGSQDKTARVWEWPTGKEKLTLKDHSDAVTRVCFAPDGKSLYTASLDHNARRFDCADGKVMRVFTGHAEGITALALNAKGDRLLTSGTEPNIRWWDVNAASDPAQQGGHSVGVNDIAFSRDAKFVVTAGADHTARLWDANSTGQIRAFEGASDWLYAASISPDDKLVAGAGADGIVRVWEAQTGRLRLSLVAWPPSAKSAGIEFAAITPEGYFNASPAWAARLRPELAAQNLPLPNLTAWMQTLHQPDAITKSWQAAPLEPAKMETPKPNVPVTPPAKPTTPAPKADAKTPTKGK